MFFAVSALRLVCEVAIVLIDTVLLFLNEKKKTRNNG